MISDERQRIALAPHDDIGTRVSPISLVASHADNTIPHEEANKVFGQISSMSRDLIGTLGIRLDAQPEQRRLRVAP